MKAAKPVRGSGDVVVSVSGRVKGLDQCIIRPTSDTIRLGEQVYHRYQIIKPQGFENEEILQPSGQGTAGLLAAVFYALAEGGTRRWKKSSLRGE